MWQHTYKMLQNTLEGSHPFPQRLPGGPNSCTCHGAAPHDAEGGLKSSHSLRGGDNPSPFGPSRWPQLRLSREGAVSMQGRQGSRHLSKQSTVNS